MAQTSPTQFLREVKQEGQKVTWPTRRETAISTGMVMVMVLLASIFFLIVDQLLGIGVRLLLGL